MNHHDGKRRKSWNFMISFSRPGRSWNLGMGQGKSWCEIKQSKGNQDNFLENCYKKKVTVSSRKTKSHGKVMESHGIPKAQKSTNRAPHKIK